MYREPDRRLSTKSQSIIVDRLLAELPHVPSNRAPQPHLPHQAHAAPVARPIVPRAPRWRPLTQVGRARSVEEDPASGSWARVALGVMLGVAMAFWPYSMCGVGLLGYFGGTLAVMTAAIWSATVAWQRRTPFAHVLSIGLLLWGLALAGDQLLQRTGYAFAQVGWTCQ